MSSIGTKCNQLEHTCQVFTTTISDMIEWDMAKNRGSFGAGVLGDTSALREALSSRGLSSSVLDQVSNVAPSGPSNVAPAIPQTDPSLALGQAQPATAQQTTPQGPQSPAFRSSEAEIAIKSMQGVVKSEQKIAESLAQLGSV